MGGRRHPPIRKMQSLVPYCPPQVPVRPSWPCLDYQASQPGTCPALIKPALTNKIKGQPLGMEIQLRFLSGSHACSPEVADSIDHSIMLSHGMKSLVASTMPTANTYVSASRAGWAQRRAFNDDGVRTFHPHPEWAEYRRAARMGSKQWRQQE